MADPIGIRRRRERAIYDREVAERDEAQYLLDELLAGANAITQDAERRAPQPVPRLEYDDTLGGLIPSVGTQATPGQEGRGVALPETEDWAAFGNRPGARELDAIQSERAAESEADRDAQHAIEVGREQRNWQARQRARSRLAELGETVPLARNFSENLIDATPDPARAAEGMAAWQELRARRAAEADQAAADAYSRGASAIGPTAMGALGGAFQGGTQGYGDEALGLIDMLRGEDYEQSRDTYRGILNRTAEGAPITSGVSRFGGSVATGMLAPAIGAGRAPSALAAARNAAAGGAAWGALAGLGESEADDASGALADAGQSAALGAAVGAPLGVAGHGLYRLGDWIASQADDVARQANPIRARAAGVRTVGMQRLADDLPGGINAYADDVRRLGISPEGSVHTPEVAGERARVIADSSGRQIRDIIEDMGRREAAAGIQPIPAIADDATAAGRPAAMRPDPIASTEAGPYRAAAPQGSVRPDRILAELDRIIRNAEGVPGAESRLQAARELAEELRTGGPISFERAQRIKREWDSLINWNAGASPTSRLTPLESQRRELRGALQGAMDEAVEREAPHLAAPYRQARRDFQVSHLTDRLAHDNELREAANRLVGSTDYGAAIAASANGGGIGRQILSAAANRVMRTREASAAATALERGSQRMRQAPAAAATRVQQAHRVGMPAAATAASAAFGTNAPRPSPSAPAAMTDEQWMQMGQPQQGAPQQQEIDPEGLSDDEWLGMMEQP